jgi:putative ABC transport system ATP-binding protein
MTEPILSCRSLSRSYNTGAGVVNAVQNIDLDIRKGEFTAIVGPSGSGKTTLLSMLGGLERPSSGEILLEGEAIERKFSDLSDYRRRGRFVFQAYNLIPHLTAIENVILPMELAEHRERSGGLALRNCFRQSAYRGAIRASPATAERRASSSASRARALANTPPVLCRRTNRQLR